MSVRSVLVGCTASSVGSFKHSRRKQRAPHCRRLYPESRKEIASDIARGFVGDIPAILRQRGDPIVIRQVHASRSSLGYLAHTCGATDPEADLRLSMSDGKLRSLDKHAVNLKLATKQLLNCIIRRACEASKRGLLVSKISPRDPNSDQPVRAAIDQASICSRFSCSLLRSTRDHTPPTSFGSCHLFSLIAGAALRISAGDLQKYRYRSSWEQVNESQLLAFASTLLAVAHPLLEIFTHSCSSLGNCGFQVTVSDFLFKVVHAFTSYRTATAESPISCVDGSCLSDTFSVDAVSLILPSSHWSIAAKHGQLR